MTSYERLKQIIDEIPELISANVTSSDPRFQAWKTKTERYLLSQFGKRSLEYDKFTGTYFRPFLITSITPKTAFITACQEDLKITQAIFQTYLDEMAEEQGKALSSQPLSFSRVFIVHGHDGELKQSVARVIEKQDIEAIILSEQANQGKTIIEKFEENSNVGGAICLFTADDVGKSRQADCDKPRARQNVVFETGYFMGKLGRDHVVILADHGIEIPSDLSGVVYTDTSNWKFELLKELKAMGYTVDLNKLI